MCLLAQLIAVDDDSATATALTQPEDLFAEAAGIPAWVGIEWIAQTVAAWGGYRAAASGEPVTPGLLLGSRRYRSRLAHWPFGREIVVVASLDFVADNGVTQVSGRLAWRDDDEGAEPLAEGTLTLYRPDSLPALGDA